jgi:hypothetical protein
MSYKSCRKDAAMAEGKGKGTQNLVWGIVSVLNGNRW